MIIQNIENLTWLIQGNTKTVNKTVVTHADFMAGRKPVWTPVTVTKYTVTVWYGEATDVIFTHEAPTLGFAQGALLEFLGKVVTGEVKL